jgi:Domain of unknown function (DUF397)
MKMDLTSAIWHKSSHSRGGHGCVEAAVNLPGIVAVRDSKDRDGGPILIFTRDEWTVFATAVRSGHYDEP